MVIILLPQGLCSILFVSTGQDGSSGMILIDATLAAACLPDRHSILIPVAQPETTRILFTRLPIPSPIGETVQCRPRWQV